MAYQTWIQLCGRLAVERGGRRVESRLPGRQGRMLLGYLVSHRDRPVPRDELVWALWGDVAPDGSDEALNAVVSKTRRVLGAEHITGRGDLRFASGEETFIDLQWAIDCLHRAASYTAWSARRLLRDELGVDPGPELQRVYHQLLGTSPTR